jgi:hypothetical protein
MFDQTIAFTDIHGTTDYTLNRVREQDYSSEYLLVLDTGRVTMKIRNSTFLDKARGVQMDQHNVELVEDVFSATPGLPGFRRKAFFTFQVQQGDTVAASREVAAALVGWLAASSGANLTALSQWAS